MNCITALGLACHNGQKVIAELLILKGANVNYQNKVGQVVDILARCMSAGKSTM